MSRLLLGVVRMRFWKKREKTPDEGIPHSRGVHLKEQWEIRDHKEKRTLLPKE